MDRLRDSDFIAIDTETNGGDVRDGRGVCYGVSFADEMHSFYLPFRHSILPGENLEFQEFRPHIQHLLDTKSIIFHNAKFDLVSLQTLGLKTSKTKFYDTMILAHLVDENRPYQGKGLDACAKYYLQNEGKKSEPEYLNAVEMFGYKGLSASITADYAATDARLTYDLYIKLVPLLRQEQLRSMWEHKAQFIRLLIEMEGHGVLIDQQLCQRMAERGEMEMYDIRYRLNGKNPASPIDLSELLLDRLKLPVVKTTPKGKPCFDKFTMEVYELMLRRMDNPLAQLILTYRGWQKSVSSNYQAYLNLVSPDGRLRPNYKLHGTVTGRMSCEKPNLQQIPRSGEKPWNGKMKRCFVPRQGFVLREFDYSQLEQRLSAGFAKEQTLLDIFADPTRDVFDEMAEALHMERYEAKTLNYSIAYGAGVPRIKYAFGVSESEASQIRDNYYRTYPKLRQASVYAQRYAERHSKIPVWSGRYRHFVKPREEAHKSYNSIVQGGAADIVERTMLRLDREGFNTDDCRMLLQVHDSVVFEIREDLASKLSPEITRCMEAVTPDFGVVFRADGKEWGT